MHNPHVKSLERPSDLKFLFLLSKTIQQQLKKKIRVVSILVSPPLMTSKYSHLMPEVIKDFKHRLRNERGGNALLFLPSPLQGAGCYPGRCCSQELIFPIHFLIRFTLLDTSSTSDTLHSNRVKMNRATLGIFGSLLGSGERMVLPRINSVRVWSLTVHWFPILIPAGKYKSLPHLPTTRTSPRAAVERRENTPGMEQRAAKRKSSRMGFFIFLFFFSGIVHSALAKMPLPTLAHNYF